MNNKNWWYLLHNPMHFQGWRRKKKYFEGWYYKIVDEENNLSHAFIPGISLVDENDKHAFIQVLDGVNGKADYHHFELEDFKPVPGRLEFSLGNNQFSTEGIQIDLPGFEANLKFKNWTPLPKSLLRPGIMGWYSYTPMMQCYHGLGSMNHFVSGQIKKGDVQFNLENAKGYVEKDWGESFPKVWIWSQCNNFKKDKNLSVFLSVAHIPWMGSFFIGFIAAVLYNGKIKVFATYNNAKRKTQLTEKGVDFMFEQGGVRLEAHVEQNDAYELKSPIKGDMVGKVNESILAKTNLRIYENGVLIIEDEGSYSGLEVAGDAEMLLL